MVVEWRQACIMQDKIKQQQMHENTKVSEWFKENSKIEVEKLGPCEDFGRNVKLNYEYYFKLFDVLEFFIMTESTVIRNEIKNERRRILATGDMQKY